jgi:hypothetical protein
MPPTIDIDFEKCRTCGPAQFSPDEIAELRQLIEAASSSDAMKGAPAALDDFISEERYACNADPMVVETRDGSAVIVRDSVSGPHFIRSRSIKWKCRNADEDFAAPAGTKYIIIFRMTKGAGVVRYYA